MKTSTYKAGGAAVLSAREALTLAECADFKSMATEAARTCEGKLILELAEVPFIDSAGLELLLELAQGCRSQGGRLRLAALSENCAEILRLTDLAGRFEVFPSVEKAAAKII